MPEESTKRDCTGVGWGMFLGAVLGFMGAIALSVTALSSGVLTRRGEFVVFQIPAIVLLPIASAGIFALIGGACGALVARIRRR